MSSKDYTQYTAKDIELLEGLDGMRERPSMYIGNNGAEGLHQCLVESLTNSIDEAIAGFGDTIYISIIDNGDTDIFCIRDHGRGIPVDMHPIHNRPVLEILCTDMHAGGKLTAESNYKISGGNYGIGLKVLNALSERLHIESWKDGYHYEQDFSKGHKLNDIKNLGKTKETGTLMSWEPDKTIFEVTKFNKSKVKAALRDNAYLNPGVKFVFKYYNDKEDVYYSQAGIVDMLNEMVDKKDTVLSKPIYFAEKEDKQELEVVLTYTNGHELLRSYANKVKMVDDGTHVTGFRSGFTKAVNVYAREAKLLKDKDENITGNELRDGLVAIVSVMISAPQYENQTKTKLANTSLINWVGSVVYNNMLEYLRKYPSQASAIVKKALSYRKLREIIAKTKETMMGTKESKKFGALSGKLSNCSSKKPDECELWVIEGLSALSTVKTARDPKYQAIFSLRGRVLNTEGLSIDKVLQNLEFRELVQSLETGVGEDCDISKLRYNKIVIATDADPGGSAIRLGLLTFFVNHMPELVKTGHLYFAEAPLFKIMTRKETIYCRNKSVLEERIKSVKGEYQISRFKGLGEMDADDFRDYVMNPKSGALVQIIPEDFERLSEIITKLQGSSSEPRKLFIEKGEI